MNTKNFLSFALLIITLSVLSSCDSSNRKICTLTTNSFEMSINTKGNIISMVDLKSNNNYIPKDSTSSILLIQSNNKILSPLSASFQNDQIRLIYENDLTAIINIVSQDTYLSFELATLNQPEKVELIIWGPFQTTIHKTIGETVGVVRNEEYAIGIQSLNIKTLGGYPWNDSDRMPAFDIFRENNPNDMHPKSDGSVLYRVEAAKPSKYGSSLQAYSRNRNRTRLIKDFNHEAIQALPYDDGGVEGSKIALFGCPPEKVLDVIEKIEIRENLPHPMIDGKWIKKSPKASAAYLITNFTENNIDKAISLTKQAGLNYLYHYGKTFESWGHFELYKGEFPNGIQSLRNCVVKAEKEGIKIGTHCLSNFITTNDKYVSPIPDKRLAKVGSSMISRNIKSTDTEIEIDSPVFFNQMKNNNLKTVMIGEELIRYGYVSEETPWKLMDCQRGAFKTKASDHKKGEKISKLLDHGYKVFLTEASLTIEMSETLAKLYNETGMRQISFDGLEGNRSTGLGTYGESLMPYTWYNSLSDELKNHLIIDASRTTHFFWHIYSRMNWGEPWYAGFRESQTEYRFKNQAYFKRNYMPGMLGWFKLSPETSLEDIEWMLARSAGYDAGYALVANMESIENNGMSDVILKKIGDWEKLRISNSFNEKQKELLRDNSKEFSITQVNDTTWTWSEIYSEKIQHNNKVKQPGEPLFSTYTINNPFEKQGLVFIMSPKHCDVSNIVVELNNYKKFEIPYTIKKGQILKFDGNNILKVYDKSWKLINEYKIDIKGFQFNKGENIITIDCSFNGYGEDPVLNTEIRLRGNNESVIWKDKL